MVELSQPGDIFFSLINYFTIYFPVLSNATRSDTGDIAV